MLEGEASLGRACVLLRDWRRVQMATMTAANVTGGTTTKSMPPPNMAERYQRSSQPRRTEKR
jgi:hypothetical protein